MQTPTVDHRPAVPVIQMRADVLRGMSHAPSARWREVLLSAGLLTELAGFDAATASPDDPRAWIAAVQALMQDLVALEAQRDALLWIDDRPFYRDVPPVLWIGVVLWPWLALEVGRRQADDIDKFVALFLFYVIPALVSVGLGVWAVFWVRKQRAGRRRDRESVSAAIAQTRIDLLEGAKRTLARDFVARVGPRLLVSAPSLATLDAEAAQAMRVAVDRWQQSPPSDWVDLLPYPCA